MINSNIQVGADKEGARTIAMLVQLASQYKSKIIICQGDKKVNAKSIMGMMALGLVSGQELEIMVDGEDEGDAMKSMRDYLMQ